MILGLCFKGTQSHESIDMKVMNLVDDLEAWNHFPWGSYLWESTYTHVYDLTRRHIEGNAGFNLPGCVWPFKNDLYRLILDVSATSDERETEWYISSEQYLRGVGIINQPPPINMQPCVENMHTSGYEKPKECFGDGFEGFGLSFNMNSPEQSKKRRSANHSGVQYSLQDEIQTFLLTGEKGDNRTVHDDVKEEGDLFDKYNDLHEAEIALLCRSERLLKPASCTLSPFVVMKRVSKKEKKRKKEMQTDEIIERPESPESTIAKIKSLYDSELAKVCETDLRLRRLGALMGGEVGPDFWRSWMGDDGKGWLSDDHLYAWMFMMYESRSSADRWTILPPYFQMAVFECESNRTVRCYFDGSVDPFQNDLPNQSICASLFRD